MTEEELKQIEAEDKNYIVSSNERINEKMKGAEPDNMAEALEQKKESDKQKKEEAKKQKKEEQAAKAESFRNMTPKKKDQYVAKETKNNLEKLGDFYKRLFIGKTPDVATILPNDDIWSNENNNFDKYLPEGSEYMKYRGNVGRMRKDLDKNKDLTPEERKKKEDELTYYEFLNDSGKNYELGKDAVTTKQKMIDYIDDPKNPYREKAQNVFEQLYGYKYEPASGKGTSINNLIGKPTDKDTTESTDTTTETKSTTDTTEKPDTSNVIGKDVANEIVAAKQEQVDELLKKNGLVRSKLDEEWNDIVNKNNDELQRIADASDLSKFLPTFAIAHYLQGDFGKKGTGKALGTLGYFLLDKIGVGLTNASLTARGMTPSQKTALQDYNEKMMNEAIKRDSSVRQKAAEEKINSWMNKNEKLIDAGFNTNITLGNDLASKILMKNFNNLDEVNLIRLKKETADWYDKLSEEDKMSMDRVLSALSANPDERTRGLLDIQKMEYELKTIDNEAEKAKKRFEIEKAKTDRTLYDKVARKQLDQLSATVNNLIATNKLTYNEAENVYQMMRQAKTDADFRKAKNTLDGINAGVKTVADFVGIFK